MPDFVQRVYLVTKHSALSQAISITDEILAVLEQKDFERLSQLEMQREPLIRQAFIHSVEQIDRIKAVHLQNLNQQVVDKLTQLKQSILQQHQQVQRASKAARAYGSHHP